MDVNKSESVYMDEDVYKKVTLAGKESWVGFIMIFLGIWSALGAVGVGVNVGANITPWKGALALVIGYTICMIYGVLVGNIGRREGLSTAVICERPFAKFGKIIPAFLVFLIGAVFIGVQADAIARIGLDMLGIKMGEGFNLTRGIVAAALCLIMMLSSYHGIKYIKYVSWIAIPTFYVVLIISLILTLKAYPGGLSSALFLEANQLSFSSVVFLGVGIYAGFSAYMSDISRFLKTTGDLLKALVIGYIAATFIPIWGVLMGAVQGTGDYWTAFSGYGMAFSILAIIGLFLGQWSTNDNNAYSSGLALSTIFTTLNTEYKNIPRLTRKKATIVPIIFGLIGSFVGFGSGSAVIVTANALGTWIVPMAGVLIAHYYVVERNGNQVATKGLSGVLSLVLIGLLTQFGLIPFAAVTSLLLTIVLYLLVFYGVERPLFGEVKIKEMEEKQAIVK